MSDNENKICDYHMDLVKDFSRIEGKIDGLTGLTKDSLVKQEGLFKKIDEHTILLTKQNGEIIKLISDQENILKTVEGHGEEIRRRSEEVIVLKEKNKNSSAIIAIIFSAIINGLFFGISKVISLITGSGLGR